MNKAVHILLVEDDKEDIKLTMELLEEQKFKLCMDVAHDGVEAMEYLTKQLEDNPRSLPDLILLDLNMPRKNGIDFLKDIRQYREFRKIPIIILTSSQSEQDIEESYIEGASCFVTKPVGIEEFQRIVEAINNFWFTIVKYPEK